MPKPRVIYEPKPGSPIAVDRSLYDRLAGETAVDGDVVRLDQVATNSLLTRVFWPMPARRCFFLR